MEYALLKEKYSHLFLTDCLISFLRLSYFYVVPFLVVIYCQLCLCAEKEKTGRKEENQINQAEHLKKPSEKAK